MSENVPGRSSGWGEGIKRWASRGFFDVVEKGFRGLGFDDAARNLRHYRSGSGADLNYTDEEAGKHPMIPAAEQLGRSRLESELFTGRTRNNELNNQLRNLREGDPPLKFTYQVQRGYDFRPRGSNWQDRINKVWEDASSFVDNPSTYPAFGRFTVASPGDFEARRKGDRLQIKGNVRMALAAEAVSTSILASRGRWQGVCLSALVRRSLTICVSTDSKPLMPSHSMSLRAA